MTTYRDSFERNAFERNATAGDPFNSGSDPKTADGPDFRYSTQRFADWPTVLLDQQQSNQTPVPRHGGAHRLPAPPAAFKGRVVAVAVAAGAVVAAGQAALTNAGSSDDSTTSEISLAGESHAIGATAVPQAAQFVAAAKVGSTDISSHADSPQVLNIAAATGIDEFNNLLSKGQKFAQERSAEEMAKLRPLFVKYTQGTFTSGFGTRWGSQHLGVDVANAIGTPIVSVGDGTVISAGPASGFGLWVRVLLTDGTITVYGHVNTITVQVGQHVLAGDEIATMGNRGFSTGPHCHFEVWKDGKTKIDPLPWLASRGISLGPEVD